METQLHPAPDADEPGPVTGTLQAYAEDGATGVLDDGRPVKLRPAPDVPWPPALERK